MKRGILVIIIALLLLGGIIWEQIYVNDCIVNIKEKTTNLYNLIFNSEGVVNETIINKTEELDKYWKDKENWLCLVINHKDMEQIGEQITKLTILTKQNDLKQCEYEVELLKYYVEGSEHILCVTFQNIW